MISSSNRVGGRLLVFAAAALILAGGSGPASADHPSAPRLLPESTVALVSVPNASELADRFMNTSLGRMSQDPQLKPLIKQVYGAVVEATDQLKERIGLSLPELLAIPQGEIALALVAPEEGPPAMVVLIEAGDQLSKVEKLIKRGTDQLDKTNAKRSEKTVSGTKIVVYDGVGPQGRSVAYFEKDDTIVAATDLGVLIQMLAVWNGAKDDTLADNRNFTAIMQRCRGAKGERPQLLWYVDPIGIMRTIGRDNMAVRLGMTLLPALGLDGLAGVGGSMIFDTEQFDSVMHAHLLLDSPRAGVLKMIALESGEVKPESWVPADVASYTTLHWDFEDSFDTLRTLFDSFREDGALDDVLKASVFETTGIDLEKDIIRSLDGRATLITRIEPPITIRSQAMLLGLKLKETEPIEKALEKLRKRDGSNLKRETYAGKKYYQVQIPQFDEVPEDSRPPAPCFGVLDGYFLATNNASLYKQVIVTAADGSKSLADELDFKLIAGKIKRQPGGDRPAMLGFDRPEETLRWFYEMAKAETARDGIRAQAENNRFFKSLDTALTEHPLPPFAVLRQYLAPGGTMVVDDETGIHYMAFSLRRKAD